MHKSSLQKNTTVTAAAAVPLPALLYNNIIPIYFVRRSSARCQGNGMKMGNGDFGSTSDILGDSRFLAGNFQAGCGWSIGGFLVN